MNLNQHSNIELLALLLGKRKANKLRNIPLAVLFHLHTYRFMASEAIPPHTPVPPLLIARELVGRALLEELSGSALYIANKQDVVDYLRLRLSGRPVEVFVALFLDAQHRVIAVEELFHGTLTQTSVYPREVVKRALEHNCACICFAHNHPSGKATPSQADRELTKVLKQALALIDVRVLDHIVVGEQSASSLAETEGL